MNTTKKTIIFVICLFLLVAIAIIYIFSELYTESDIPNEEVSDALKFKQDYESLNGQTSSSGSTIRSIEISEDNPFIYKSADEIVEMIDNKETFVVYFGFASCPWCRSVLPSMIESAKKNNINQIYYVDILNIRDKYELNDKNEPVKSAEGTKGYYSLLERIGNVLEDYTLTYKTSKGKTKVKNVGEKRIFAPNVVIVKNGEATYMEDGICAEQTDAYMELTEEMLKNSVEKFDCAFGKIKKETSTCSVEHKC